MHQIARIEFRNANFPYARGLCPLATPARGQAPWTPVFVTNFTAPRRKAILDPPVDGGNDHDGDEGGGGDGLIALK